MRTSLSIPLVLALAGAARAEAPLVAKDAGWEKVPVTLQFGEGPAWSKAGFLLFEDTRGNKTMKLEGDGKVSVYRAPSGRSNGQAYDLQGRLVVAEGADGDGGRRIARTEKDGKVVTVVDRFQGKRFNSPNDITIDGHGRIYFTDPRYSANRSDLELDKEAVYRVDPDGKLTRIIDSLTRPNGIAVTRDGKTLYVADNASPGGVVKLMAFDLDARGAASNGRAVYDFVSGRGIDGMTLDAGGRIWATAGTADKAGVYVFEPDGKRQSARLAKFVPISEEPTNCTFGGKDRSVLYVTTRTGLYKLQTAVKGQPSPPGK
jgi:sugar lactone lactonase YvrE